MKTGIAFTRLMVFPCPSTRYLPLVRSVAKTVPIDGVLGFLS
jgi:hypothetical protein